MAEAGLLPRVVQPVPYGMRWLRGVTGRLGDAAAQW